MEQRQVHLFVDLVVDADDGAFVAHVLAQLSRKGYFRVESPLGEELFDDRPVGVVPACEAGTAQANADAPFFHGFPVGFRFFLAIKIVIVVYITSKKHQ